MAIEQSSTSEDDLRKELELHRAQLDSITEQCSMQNSYHLALITLKSNLEELCQLIEGQLVEIEKQKLFSELNEIDSLNTSASVSIDHDKIEEIKTEDSSKVEPSEINDNSFECSVPLMNDKGQVSYHDALVILDDVSDDLPDNQTDQLKAFFLYPTDKSMLTCPYYLRGNCRFDQDCKYSHGKLVQKEQLRPKISINFNESDDLEEKETFKYCLVQTDPDNELQLWSNGEILDIDSEQGRVLVRIKQNSEQWFPIDQLILLNATSVDSESEETSSDNEVEDNPTIIHSESRFEASNPNFTEFGEWEKYTKGIGSKLLAKMGYESGLGLGKKSQGIVEPVEQIIYPAGKSLDYCIQLKKKRKERQDGQLYLDKVKKKKLKFLAKLSKDYQRGRTKGTFNNKNPKCMFDLLNNLKKPEQSKPKSNQTTTIKNLKTIDQRTLNVKSMQIKQSLRKAQINLKKMENCFNHLKQDLIQSSSIRSSQKSTLNQYNDRLREQMLHVEHLRGQSEAIEKEIKNRNNQNKLLNF